MRPAPSRARVVIVAKTHMGEGRCVGGIVEGSGRAVRLLPPGKFCHPPRAPFQVGEVWEMFLRRRDNAEPPHTEDHDEWDARRVGAEKDLVGFIERHARPWVGEPAGLFGGLLKFRPKGSAYLPRTIPLPGWSVEFWRTPAPLAHTGFDSSHRYHMRGSRPFNVKYLGVEQPVLTVPAGALVRVSLARWWTNPDAPSEGETCSLQLSGWFGLPPDTPRVGPPAPPPINLDELPY